MKIRETLSCCILVAACFLPGASLGEEAPPAGSAPREDALPLDRQRDASIAAVVARLEARYRKIRNFKAHFVQENRTSIPGRTRKHRGTIAFSRPGKIRWDYTTPPQQIIIDGDRMFTVKPALNQVVIQKLASAIRSRDVIALLTGEGDLAQSFVIGAPHDWKPEDPIPGTDAVALTPKSSELGISRLILLVSRTDALIRRSYLFDTFGNVTRIDYDDYTIDTNTFPDGFFTFTPTPEMEVIEAPF